MPDLPYPALMAISYYSSPYQMLQYAQVSRNWYAAFTSDKAWLDWDVFGLGQGICRHYLASKQDFSENDWLERPGPLLKGQFTNWYGLLYRIRAGDFNRTESPDSYALKMATRSFIRALGRRRCESFIQFAHLPKFEPQDEDIVCSLLRQKICAILSEFDFPELFRTSRKVFLAALTIFDELPWRHGLFDYDRLVEDRESALAAMNISETIFFSMPGNIQADERLFEYQFERYSRAPRDTDHAVALFRAFADWDLPVEIAQKKSWMLWLVKKIPLALTNYSRACDKNGIEPDMDVVYAALNAPQHNFGTRSPYLPDCPAKVMRNKGFVLELLDEHDGIPRWNLISRYWLSDDDVLEAVLSKCREYDYETMDWLDFGWLRGFAIELLRPDIDFETKKKILALEEKHQWRDLRWLVDKDVEEGEDREETVMGYLRLFVALLLDGNLDVPRGLRVNHTAEW